MPYGGITVMEKYQSKRQFDRVPVNLAVKINAYGEEHIGTVINLSPGGAFVRMEVKLPVGLELDFSIIMRDGSTPPRLPLSGRIVHQKPAGMGIRFDTLSPEALERIIRLLSAHYKKDSQSAA